MEQASQVASTVDVERLATDPQVRQMVARADVLFNQAARSVDLDKLADSAAAAVQRAAAGATGDTKQLLSAVSGLINDARDGK